MPFSSIKNYQQVRASHEFKDTGTFLQSVDMVT